MKFTVSQNRQSLIWLALMYAVQGMNYGFYQFSMMVLFIESGADYKELGILSIITLPIAFKFLIAPILDVYYFEWAGKRKTYIISTITLIGFINLYIADKLEIILTNVEIDKILGFGLTITFLTSLMGIGIDGWLV